MTPRPAFTGRCRFCGCGSAEDESLACTTSTGDPCHWVDAERTVCSNPPCVIKLGQERVGRREALKELQRKRTPAEIHALKMQEARDRRKRSRQNKAGAA